MRCIALCILCFNLFYKTITSQIKYPFTKSIEVTDTFFNTIVNDPYRWLENQTSSETQDWVARQNKFTREYIDKISGTFSIREKIKSNAIVEFSAPKKRGKYYFELRRLFGYKELAIYYTDDIRKDNWDVLFVNKDLGVKKDEVISVENFEVSKDGKYIAYTFNTNGSDWKEIKVGDLETQKNLLDHLYDVKMSTIVWRGNGFYYTRLEREKGEEYKQAIKYPKLYYHKLGTLQQQDSLIFKRNDSPYNFFNPSVSRDERFLIIEDCNLNTNYRTYYYFDFKNQQQTSLLPLIKKTGKVYELLDIKGDELLFCEISKNNKRIIKINTQALNKHQLINNIGKDLILRDVYHYSGNFIQLCYYNQQEYILVINEKNELVKKVEIPFGEKCSFSGIDEETNELILNYGSVLFPPVLASMNLVNFKFEIIEPVKISHSKENFVVEKHYYKSDTAYVPMLLLYNKKKLKMDGGNPTLIEFYGGYGTIYSPSFDPSIISFVEDGGVYAYAMIRGGGEKGTYWEKDGSLLNRLKSVNDIVNASNYLVEKSYTKTEKVAITGTSHGGLMAMLAAIKAPDKFGAVVAKVGVYDMLRFEKFTVGSVHQDEHGTVKDSLNFIFLKNISPLHNISKTIKYPPILIMTSDYDDRVPPLHSYKMAAALQNESNIKSGIVLLRVEKNSGHSGSRTYEKYIDESSDFLSFLQANIGVKK